MTSSRSWRKRAWTVAALAVLCAVAAGWWWRHDRTQGRVFRIGHQASPPGQLLDARNRPVGPIPEALTEAARLTGIQLEWVFAPEGPDKALAAGRVDLWPLIIQRASREGKVYITEPYLRLTYWIVARE